MDVQKIKRVNRLHEFLEKPSIGRRSGRTYKMLLNAVHETDFADRTLVLCHPSAYGFMMKMASDIARELGHTRVQKSQLNLTLDKGTIRFGSFESYYSGKFRGMRDPIYEDHFRG